MIFRRYLRSRDIRLAAMWLITMTWLMGTPARAAEEFTAPQRAEIVKILRDALRLDPSILRDAIEAMRNDENRQQVETARAAIAAARAELNNPADYVAGNPLGDVTVVEFFDVRCTYCRKLQPAMAALLRGDPNIRLVFKDLPILGQPSVLGAKALLAAQPQGGYGKLRELLMTQAAPPTLESIRADAQSLGLDAGRLLREMDSPAVAARIDANLALAARLGIQGTPAMVIGDVLIPGAVDVAELQQSVQQARAARR